MKEFVSKEFTVLTPFSIIQKDVAEIIDTTGEPSVIKISGYANWSGNDESGKTYIDLTGDVVVPHGTDTSVWETNPQILWQHNRDLTIGKGLRLEKRLDGLYLEAEIHADAMDQKDWYRLKSGLVSMFSIGFRTLDGEWRQLGNEEAFFITKSLLMEVSIVSIPCNSKSSFSQIKSLDGGFTSGDRASFSGNEKGLEAENQQTEIKDIPMKITVKRADLLSTTELETFKSLGGDTEAEVEVSLGDFIKEVVAKEVATVLEAKAQEEAAEKEAAEEAAKVAAADAEKAAADAAAMEAEQAELAAAQAADAEEKELADELFSLKELVDNLKVLAV